MAEGDATDDAAARPRRLDLGLWSEHLDILVVLRKSTDFERKGWRCSVHEEPWLQPSNSAPRGKYLLSAVKRLEIWQAIQRYATNPTLAVSRDLLSRETSVPERTLDHICHAFSGLSPITYIKRGHMSVAHAMLCRGGPDATVTQIATFCGFSELGRFSVAYRQRYGQSPSQTLRQSAQLVVTSPPALSGPSMDDLIRRNRALLAKAAAACALHRRIAAMASTVRAEGERLRLHAETIGRQPHVRPVGLT